MRRSRLVLAALFALVGLVWIGQGVGLIGGSVMTGSPFWAIVGAVLLVVAVVIVMIERRRPTGELTDRITARRSRRIAAPTTIRIVRTGARRRSG